MAGLAILKHTYDLCDEVLCKRWVENPLLPFLLRRGVLPAPAAELVSLQNEILLIATHH